MLILSGFKNLSKISPYFIVADRAIVIVTHNMEQASRVSNRTAFFYMGDMVEYDETDKIIKRPKDKRLNDYLPGMFS